MIKLAIEEEYGYRYWVAYLNKEEYDELIERWKTIRGLHSTVPVQLIVPQAKLAESIDDVNLWQLRDQGAKHAHVFDCEDSYLDGADYEIPEADNFWMAGKEYSREEIDAARDSQRLYLATVHHHWSDFDDQT